jgi:hypothetical protein
VDDSGWDLVVVHGMSLRKEILLEQTLEFHHENQMNADHNRREDQYRTMLKRGG